MRVTTTDCEIGIRKSATKRAETQAAGHAHIPAQYPYSTPITTTLATVLSAIMLRMSTAPTPAAAVTMLTTPRRCAKKPGESLPKKEEAFSITSCDRVGIEKKKKRKKRKEKGKFSEWKGTYGVERQRLVDPVRDCVELEVEQREVEPGRIGAHSGHHISVSMN